MWFSLVGSFIFMFLFILWQTPFRLWKSKASVIGFTVLNVVSFISILLLLFRLYQMPDGPVRTGIIWVSTVGHVLLTFTSSVVFFRLMAYHLGRHSHIEKLKPVLNNKALFLMISLALTVMFFVPGVRNYRQTVTRQYDVEISTEVPTENLRVALISDLHLGAGANHQKLDQMAEAINAMDADLVAIAGDLADSSTSAQDMDYFVRTMQSVHTKYGVFYAEGNHEVECRVPILNRFSECGITDLTGKAVTLPNGAVLVGRENARNRTVSEIIRDSGADLNAPRLVIQHKPTQFKQLAGECDLLMCGHTHGYSHPFQPVFFVAFQDCVEGLVQRETMTAITTSGVSCWGRPVKWPSKDEVVCIDVSFKEVTA